jgi:hypothetical protein
MKLEVEDDRSHGGRLSGARQHRCAGHVVV